jgi:hypothetical protein
MNNIEKEITPLGHDGLPWPQTMDAKIWADEFCKRNSASDHDTMIGWFANAIMVGYDAPHEEDVEPCCGNFEECKNMCVSRAWHWEDKYIKTKSLYDNLKMIDNHVSTIKIIN